MEAERRTLSRKKPKDLSYIQFGDGEIGGIVCDASEQGLGFQTVAPVPGCVAVQLRISPNPKEDIEILGTVAWTDESKRLGGLRFDGLCPEACEQIRAWLTAPETPEAEGQEFSLPGPLLDDAIRLPSGRQHHPDDAVPRRDSVLKSASQTRFHPGSHRRNIRTLLIGFIICVLVPAPLLLTGFRFEIGSLFIHLGEELKGENRKQPDPSPPALSGGQNPSQTRSDAKVPVVETAEKSAETPGKSGLSAVVQNTSPDSALSVPAAPERSADSPRVSNLPARKRHTSPVRELWSEIQGGNIAAEVTLAEIYLHGDGVRKNCEQARVLLRAASRSGNVQAINDLRDLKKTKCR